MAILKFPGKEQKIVVHRNFHFAKKKVSISVSICRFAASLIYIEQSYIHVLMNLDLFSFEKLTLNLAFHSASHCSMRLKV